MNTKTFEHLYIPATITTLNNGLAVASCQTNSALTEVHRTVALGSMNDGAHLGIAHFIEHMLFEGPTRDSVHPLFRQLARKAVDTNASTGHFSTCYETSNGEDVAEQLDAVLGMTREIVASQNVMDLERQVILQEVAEAEGPSRVERWEIQQMFPHVPEAHHLPHGTKKSVEAITLDDLKAHHQLWYGASNSLILVASQLPHQAVLDLVEKSWLGQAPAGKSLRPLRPMTAYCVRTEYSTLYESDSITFYTPVPASISQRDCFLLGMVGDLLADPSFGLLWKRLRTELGAVYGIESGFDDTYKNFYCQAGVSRARMEQVETEYRAAIAKIARRDYPHELFDSIIARYYKRLICEKERSAVDGCLDELEDIWLSGDMEDIDWLQEVWWVGRDSLAEAAKKYLLDQPYGCLRVLQNEDK